MRIKTNIIELSKLYKEPCERWFYRFIKGKIDAHKAFFEFGQEYEWLYKNSDYDLIGWQIENNVFYWEKYSWAVTKFCPENFNSEKFNWKDYSNYVAEYCPEKIDPTKFNWKHYSWAVAKYCCDKIDFEKFNWQKQSWAVAKYCPEKLSLRPKT